MNIGMAARASGVSAKMIRYYEDTGLLPAADRLASGYRAYVEDDVHRLVFVRRARDLGFSIDEIKGLLGLWSNRSRSDKEVREIARKHVADLQKQAAQLQDMIGTLNDLIGACQKGGRPDCPIMQELSGGKSAPRCCSPDASVGKPRKDASSGKKRTASI